MSVTEISGKKASTNYRTIKVFENQLNSIPVYLKRKITRESDIRGEFFRDQTAIIHSAPFRRLKNKTQVSNQYVSEFKGLWISGMEKLVQACNVYVTAIDSDPKAKQAFKDSMPKINSCAWSRIESVGRNQMHYLLLVDSSPAASKLRKLPYSEQRKAIEVGCEVLTDTGDKLKVKSENLTVDMVNQVFANDHIRDIGAQRAFRESKKIVTKIKAEQPTEIYKINGTKLEVYTHCSFTRQQLLNILQDMC
jgi:hypothetical protein